MADLNFKSYADAYKENLENEITTLDDSRTDIHQIIQNQTEERKALYARHQKEREDLAKKPNYTASELRSLNDRHKSEREDFIKQGDNFRKNAFLKNAEIDSRKKIIRAEQEATSNLDSVDIFYKQLADYDKSLISDEQILSGGKQKYIIPTEKEQTYIDAVRSKRIKHLRDQEFASSISSAINDELKEQNLPGKAEDYSFDSQHNVLIDKKNPDKKYEVKGSAKFFGEMSKTADKFGSDPKSGMNKDEWFTFFWLNPQALTRSGNDVKKELDYNSLSKDQMAIKYIDDQIVNKTRNELAEIGRQIVDSISEDKENTARESARKLPNATLLNDGRIVNGNKKYGELTEDDIYFDPQEWTQRRTAFNNLYGSVYEFLYDPDRTDEQKQRYLARIAASNLKEELPNGLSDRLGDINSIARRNKEKETELKNLKKEEKRQIEENHSKEYWRTIGDLNAESRLDRSDSENKKAYSKAFNSSSLDIIKLQAEMISEGYAALSVKDSMADSGFWDSVRAGFKSTTGSFDDYMTSVGRYITTIPFFFSDSSMIGANDGIDLKRSTKDRAKIFAPRIIMRYQLGQQYEKELQKERDAFKLWMAKRGITVHDSEIADYEQYGTAKRKYYDEFVSSGVYENAGRLEDPYYTYLVKFGATTNTEEGRKLADRIRKADKWFAQQLLGNAFSEANKKQNIIGNVAGSVAGEIAWQLPGMLVGGGLLKNTAKTLSGKIASNSLWSSANFSGRIQGTSVSENIADTVNIDFGNSDVSVSPKEYLSGLNEAQSEAFLKDTLPELIAEGAVGPLLGAAGSSIARGVRKALIKTSLGRKSAKFVGKLAKNKIVRNAGSINNALMPTYSGALGEWGEERFSDIYSAVFNTNNSVKPFADRIYDALSFKNNWEQWAGELLGFAVMGSTGLAVSAGKAGVDAIIESKRPLSEMQKEYLRIDNFVKENAPDMYNNGDYNYGAAVSAFALAEYKAKNPNLNVIELNQNMIGKRDYVSEDGKTVNMTPDEVMTAALTDYYVQRYPDLQNIVDDAVKGRKDVKAAMNIAIRNGMVRDLVSIQYQDTGDVVADTKRKMEISVSANKKFLDSEILALRNVAEISENKTMLGYLSGIETPKTQIQYNAMYEELQSKFGVYNLESSYRLAESWLNSQSHSQSQDNQNANKKELNTGSEQTEYETTDKTPEQAQPIAEANAVTPEPATAIPATKQLNDNILPGTQKIENIDSILAESAAENKSNAEIAEQIINAENAPAEETVTETEQTATAQQTAEIPQETTVSATEQQQDTVKTFEQLESRDNEIESALSRVSKGLVRAYEISIDSITGENAETANAIKTLMESALGVEVVFYHNPNSRFNDGGFHTGGRIFIRDEILEKSNVAIRAAGHEFLHFLAKSNPELYKQLQEVLLEKAKTNKFLQEEYDKTYSIYSNKAIQELINNYSGSVNMDLINEEFTNKVFAKFFTGQNFAKEILSNIENENPGIIKQLWEAFKKYVNAFIRAAQSDEKLRETYKEHLKKDFSKFENLLKSVIKEYQAKNRERIAQWNKQEQIQQEVVGSTAANGVQAVKVSEINVDPARFQFKQDMKKDTGVSTSSQITAKKWNPLYAGLLYLWQDKDGKLFVVNGHHRLDLAKRLGVEEINAQIDREVDGVTAEQAYIKGALINIKNGNGTVYDYANFFRKSKMSRQDALDDGFIAKGKTLAGIRANEQLKRSMTGWLIAQGSEDLWSWYVNQDENAENKITDEMFATIVEKADGVDSIELYAINAINRGAVKNMAELNSVLDGAKSRYDAANQDSGMSDGFLFGDSEADAMIEADKKLGDFARKKSNELQGRISMIKKPLNDPETAKAVNVKIGNGDARSTEQKKKELQEYEKQKVMFDNPFVNRDFVEAEMRKAETGEETAAVAPATKTEKKKLIKEKAESKTDVKESAPAETDSKPKQKTEKTETKATLPRFKLEHIEYIDKKDIPKDVAWKDRKFKSENYYASVRVGIAGNDAYFEFRTGISSLQQKVFYKISDFRDTSIMQIRREIEDYFSGNSEAYPMGKNFDDALDSLHDDGMRAENYSTLKPMTASAPAAKTPKTETQSASTPAMSDEFPLLTKEEDANDFQLKGEPLSEKDQQKIEDRKAEEGKKKAEKETLDLPIEENKTPASAPVKSLDDLKGRSKRLKPKAEKDAIERIKVIENNINKNIDTHNAEDGIKLAVMVQGKKYTPEMLRLKKKYEGTDQWMKAPNGKHTNLTEFQWLQVRTKAFKEWFGDWMAVAKLKMIDSLKAIKLVADKSGLDIKEIYKNLPNGENKYDGSKVRFVNATLGKIISHKGYDTRKIIPQLKEIFDNSVPLDFEEEQAQPNRPDGTPHKQHRNFKGYHNYLGKFNDGTSDYFVRFTVQEVNTRNKNYIAKQLHSTYISDVEIYKAEQSFFTPEIITEGKRETVGSDDKLMQIIAKVKSDSENSSKILDENNEPLVVYHGSPSRFTVFDSNRGTNIEAIWHTSDFAVAAHFGSGSITRFDESLLERFENVRSLSELSSFAKKELGINVAITTQNISEKEAKEYGVSPGIRYYMESEYPVGGSVSTYLSGAKDDANALQKAKENLRRAIYKSINPESQGFTYANYLRIQNPLEVDANGTPYHSILFKKKKLNTESIATIAKKHGHDGVIIRNVLETDYENQVTTDYITFDSTQIKSATDNIGTFDKTNPDIRFSLLDADALKDLSPLERLTEAFEKSEPNEIDRNIYIVFRKYMDELIEQGSVKQDSDFARANAVLQNYERDHGIHQASLLYRKMIADKMFGLPVFNESIGTADEALKTAPEVPKDFANAVRTVFTGAKFKSVFTEEERKTVDHGEAIEAAQKPEETDKEQSNDENLLHLTDEQMEKDGYTAEQKKEQKAFAERIEELGRKLDNKEISAKQAKDELADIYDKYTTPFDNFISRYSAMANSGIRLEPNDVIGTAWIEFQNRIEDYAKSPTGDFTRSLVNATNTSITREKNETNKQWKNEVKITNENGENIVGEIAATNSDTRGEKKDAMRAVKKQLIGIARKLRSRLKDTKNAEDRLVLLRRSWVAIAIVRIGGMAYERRNVVDWLDKHIAEIEKDCEKHGVVWDRTYGKGTDARYNKDLRAIFPNIHMSILSEEMNENMKKAGVLQMISSALSAAELPTNYQKDISWLERLFIPSAQYFNKTPQIFKFYTALDDMNRYKMDMLANLTGDNGLGDNYIVTMQRLEDRKPEKAKSLYRYIIDADRFRIGGEVNVVTGNKRRYWYTYHDGSSSRDFNTAAERDKAMELDPQYKKQKLIARSEPKDIRFVATDKDGKTIGSYKSFTEAHIAVIQNEIKTLAGKGITIDGTNHKFDNEQLLALQSFRLMALNGYNQIAKRFAEIRNHIESSGGDFASFLKEQKVFDIYDEFVKMGKAASYYMPRIRKPGRYKITAKRGKETILYFVDSVSKIRLKAEIRKLKKDGWTDVEYEDTGDHTNAEIVGLDLTRLNTIVNQALQQMEKDAFKNGVLDNKMLKDSFGMELTIDSGVTDKKGNKHDNIEIVFDKSHYQAELNLALREFLKDSVAVVKENDSTITAKWIVPANQGEMLAKTFIKSIMNIHGKQTVLGSFTETLQNVIGNIIKASGYRARSISRNEKIGKEVTQGYVENPLEAMKMFLSAMAEGQSRTRFAHASAAIAGGWDYSYDDFMNEKHPGEEKSAMYYIEYCIERDKRAVKPHTQMHKDIMNTTEFVLTNADLADRMIATVNGIASIYFLSSPSSALVNTLALYTHVPAAISKSLDESALKAVANVTGGAKRYIQYALARRNGKEAKGLTDEEKAVFGLMSRLGYDSNSNMANALATLDQNTAFGKAQKIMMASFSITESMSRASAIYAAYQAIVEKMKKQGKKFDWKNEDQLRAVLAAAKKVSDQALVDFSKGGKVGIMKNKTARKVIAPFMLFMSFPLNTISLLLKHDANIAPMLDDLGLETKTDKASLIKKLVKGSAWMILSSTLLAGLDTMLPISVLQGWFGGDDDDPEKWRKEIAKQLATVFGLIPEDSTYSKVADRMLNYGAASFMNLDLRGSLSTWTILQKTKFTAEDFAKRLFGAPGSLAASFSRSADEFSNAYRDGIWNPESIIRGTEYALPKLLASPLKAYRESVYGVTTLSGKSILDPDAPDTALTEEEQKLYLTGDEREWWKSYNFYRRALGFNPADVSQKRAEIYANKLVKQGYANRKKELGERIENYVQAVKDGKRSFNSAEWEKIEQDAEEMRKEYFDLPEEQRKDISQVTNKWFNEKIESVTKLSTKQKASAGDNKAKRRLLKMRQRKENESQEPIKRSK